MIIKTRDFGRLEVSESQVFTLTEPILGFENVRRYALLEQERTHPIVWFQSLERTGLVFPLIDASTIGLDYSDDLSKIKLDDIEARSAQDVRTMLIVVIPHDISGVRTNLRAPLLLSNRCGLGKQVVFYESAYPIQFHLMPSANNTPEQVVCR